MGLIFHVHHHFSLKGANVCTTYSSCITFLFVDNSGIAKGAGGSICHPIKKWSFLQAYQNWHAFKITICALQHSITNSKLVCKFCLHIEKWYVKNRVWYVCLNSYGFPAMKILGTTTDVMVHFKFKKWNDLLKVTRRPCWSDIWDNVTSLKPTRWLKCWMYQLYFLVWIFSGMSVFISVSVVPWCLASLQDLLARCKNVHTWYLNFTIGKWTCDETAGWTMV